MRTTTMNTCPKVLAITLLTVIACKDKAEPVAPGAQVASKPISNESAPIPTPSAPAEARDVAPPAPSQSISADGIWGVRATTPLTLTQLKSQLPDATFSGVFAENRGAGKKSVQAMRGDVTVTFFFETPSKPFVWFELDGRERLCVDATCIGDPLAKAAAHVGSRCVANHDGQGFSMTFTCGTPSGTFLVQAALPDDVRQDHPLGQATKPFPTQDLVAANATTVAFVWVAPSQTWSPSRYDEGDR